MQYTVRIHEIVITIHCDSGASYDFAKIVYHVHATQTTGYHTVLTILIQFCSYLFCDTFFFQRIYMYFVFKMCTRTDKNTLLSLLFD